MSNRTSRIRNRMLRAYGVMALAAILIIILVIFVIGLVGKPSNNQVVASPTPLLPTATAAPTAEPSEDPDTTPTPDPSSTPDPSPGVDETYMYVNVSGSKLNMRNVPSTTNSNVIASLDKGVVVTVLETPEEAPDWRKIKTEDGTTGYVMASFLAQPPITVNAIVNVSDSLNVRKQPARTAELVTTLSANDEVTILQYEITGGWVKIKTADGKVGYCMQQYLKSSN